MWAIVFGPVSNKFWINRLWCVTSSSALIGQTLFNKNWMHESEQWHATGNFTPPSTLFPSTIWSRFNAYKGPRASFRNVFILELKNWLDKVPSGWTGQTKLLMNLEVQLKICLIDLSSSSIHSLNLGFGELDLIFFVRFKSAWWASWSE